MLTLFKYDKHVKKYNGPLYRWLRRFWDVDAPNPYGTVDTTQQAPDEVEIPLCLNCLAREETHQWICPNCGWPISFNGSQMPYIDVFCMGALFRSGVDCSVELTRFRTIGLIVYSLVHYNIFAPLYWFRMSQAKKGKSIFHSYD